MFLGWSQATIDSDSSMVRNTPLGQALTYSSSLSLSCSEWYSSYGYSQRLLFSSYIFLEGKDSFTSEYLLKVEGWQDFSSYLYSSSLWDDLYIDFWTGGYFSPYSSEALSTSSSLYLYSYSSFCLLSLNWFRQDSLKLSSSYKLLFRFLALKVISSNLPLSLPISDSKRESGLDWGWAMLGLTRLWFCLSLFSKIGSSLRLVLKVFSCLELSDLSLGGYVLAFCLLFMMESMICFFMSIFWRSSSYFCRSQEVMMSLTLFLQQSFSCRSIIRFKCYNSSWIHYPIEALTFVEGVTDVRAGRNKGVTLDSIYCGDMQVVINLFPMDKQKSKSRTALLRTISLSPNCAPEDVDLQAPNTPQGQTNSLREQSNVHQFILSQFKQKYDLLKSQYQSKKKEADSLLYDKKKLEIELLNHNVEYYQKEIVRLRGEVEKFQMENEENKHRFFVAENSRKDLEATSKVKQEELKQTLKQLEKEKIATVELKYQLSEKDRNFANVISDIQKNNHDISEKYDKTAALLQKAENDLRAKVKENEEMRKKVEVLEKELKGKEEDFANEFEKFQLNEYRSKHRIDDLEEEIKEISSKENEKLKKLEIQVKQLENKRKSEEFLLAEKTQIATYSQNLRKKEQQIALLQQKLREISIRLQEKQFRISSLQEKLKNVCSIELLNESQEKYAEMLTKHQANERSLENKIISLEKELQMSKLMRSGPTPASDPRMKADFQQLLKAQIQQNSKLKMQLSFKIDEIFALKSKIEQQQIKQSLLQNQIDILKKRQRAQQKNSKIGFQIEMQNLKNDVDSLRRKLQVSETKLSIKMKEVKDKDAFISNTIIGRSRQEDVPFVVAQLKRIFQSQYVGKLSQANLKISDLQSKLSSK